MMDQAIAFRKMTNDFMAKVRNEMQAASRDDIDNVMLSVRHMEKRLLDRMDQLAIEVAGLRNGEPSRAGRKPNPGSQARKPLNRDAALQRPKPG